MKKSTGIGALIIIVLVAGIGFVALSPTGNAVADGKYAEFAQCLTDSGAKMYGAYWCPHCNDQKEMFGHDWDKIRYVECSLPNRQGQTSECSLEGIQSYPTWEFSDGKRASGLLTFEQLSEKTGCSLNSGDSS